MMESLRGWLVGLGLDARAAEGAALAVGLGAMCLLALLANVVAKRILVRGVQAMVDRTSTSWDDRIATHGVFRRLSHLAPAIVLYHFGPTVLAGHPAWANVLQQAALIYMLVVGVAVVDGILNAAGDIGRTAGLGRDLPLKSFIQVVKLVLYGVAAVVTLSLVLGKSPFLLLSGFGAMTAVLLLVFRDAILGFVAGIQLSANQMVAVGDWIEMPRYGADGDVIEVALTTVKVQNWDKTITTIPTYALISESFKNWRGMKESGGRRIKRAIHLDLRSIRFCDDALLQRLSRIQLLQGYLAERRAEVEAWNAAHKADASSPVNGRRLTNIGTFRAYVIAYLRDHPQVHQDMTFLVRHLPPDAQGLPLEIYVFSRDQRWAQYESIQADIFDHLLAAVPAFDLRVYQSPSGADVTDAVQAWMQAARTAPSPGEASPPS